MKSERLKKLENELKDLESWKSLGLVPKKDIDKHEQEVGTIRQKIQEEKERLAYLKENGDEEYTAPKRGTKQAFEPQTMPDTMGKEENYTQAMNEGTTSYGASDHTTLFDLDDSDKGAESSGTQEHSADDDPFSDRNRVRRFGDSLDPENDSW
jgi:hypothetical protein